MNTLRNELNSREPLGKQVQITKTPLLSTSGEGNPDTDPGDLLKEVHAHIKAVQDLMSLLTKQAEEQVRQHDSTKHDHLEEYVRDYSTRGDGKNHWWSEVHNVTERHHLPDEIDDLNIVDLMEHICDTVAAGLARDGKYRPERIDPDKLQRIVDNTVTMLIRLSRVTPQPK